MERSRRKVGFLEDIREGPKAVALGHAAGLEGSLRGKRGRVRGIVPRVAGIGRGVPLGVVNRPAGGPSTCVLCPLAHDAAPAAGQLGLRIGTGLNESVGRIVMGADEI